MSGGVVFTQLEHDGEPVKVRVGYNFHAGYKGDSIDPPEAPFVEIDKIDAVDGAVRLPQEAFYDEHLLECCLNDALARKSFGAF